MTAQVHDHSTHETGQRPASRAARDDVVRQAGQPRWLWPGVAAGLVLTGLVIAGVLSLSAVLYIGLFGGMLLMHGGGHGGHGGHSGHEDHGGDTPSDTQALSHRSHGSKSEQPGSAAGLDDRATSDPKASETDDHDQHTSHGCH